MNIINNSIWTSLIQMNYKMNFIVTIKLRPFSQNSFLRFNFISETSIGNFLTNFISTSSLDLSIRQKIATRTVTISKHSTFDSVEMTESVVKIGSIGSRSRRMLEKKRSVPFSSALLAKGDRDPGKDLRMVIHETSDRRPIATQQIERWGNNSTRERALLPTWCLTKNGWANRKIPRAPQPRLESGKNRSLLPIRRFRLAIASIVVSFIAPYLPDQRYLGIEIILPLSSNRN